MQKTDELMDAFDVRSLRMLQLLLETRSVTEAGRILGVSQPAASRILARLRHTLRDPLIVRGNRGNVLTADAEAMKPRVDESLQALSSLLQRQSFQPCSVQRTVRVATTDHGAVVVLAKLAEAIATEAPGVTLEVAPWSAHTLGDLETSRLDLALDGESEVPENFHFKTLHKERYACLVRDGHPLLKEIRSDGCLEFRKAASYPQVMILCPHGDRLERDSVLERLGHDPDRVIMRTPYFATATLLLQGTDSIALLPTRLGEMITRDASFALIPLREKTDFQYRLIWHERTQKDPCMSWLRGQIYRLGDEQKAPARRREREAPAVPSPSASNAASHDARRLQRER